MCLLAYLSVAATQTVGEELDAKILQMEGTITSLSRQLMQQQMQVEEKARSDGDSGIKNIRLRGYGTRSYYTESYSGHSVAAMHDHANNIRTVGMGELAAVLNGVEFRTRHNDYRLYMPSQNGDYDAVENITFPSVPQSVLDLSNVDDQINELREYFKAFATQNETHRNYKPHFPAVLCYLEGGWTTTVSDDIEETHSDRHFVDATSWFDLIDKVAFTTYTGTKSRLENLPYLPTKIMSLINGTIPLLAQWNYRIVCHPLKDDLPTSRLQVIDDLNSRFPNRDTIAQFENTRAARFQLNPELNPSGPLEFQDQGYKVGFLDKLMAEIPGKDNYGGNITDDAFQLTALDAIADDGSPLNAAFYHRVYKLSKNDAMGSSMVFRGFNDRNLFVALTTQPKIAPMSVQSCRWRSSGCETLTQKATYAIPLEIIYLNPLAMYNPWSIPYKGDANTDEGKTVTAGDRWGRTTLEGAFNGSNSKVYYRTPIELFTGSEVGRDSADTTRGVAGVLDGAGVLHNLTASGTRILLPKIAGVGVIRQRYPIMPTHDEGNSIKKELEALKDIFLDLDVNRWAMRDAPDFFNINVLTNTELELETSEVNGHFHTVILYANDAMLLQQGHTIHKTTSRANGHTHSLEIVMSGTRYKMANCDGKSYCWDGHSRYLEHVQ